MKIPLNNIIIGERQRLNIGDLSDLDSMADPEVGLIQPIIVHKTLQGYELVAGRRRLAKATALGWQEIEANEKDTLTIVQKNKMELFEDVGRTDRPWQDRCLSIAKLHYLMKAEKSVDGEDWTTKHTSIATGFGAGATIVRKMLTIADILRREPKDEEAWGAENFYEAYRKCVIDRNEREARAELERRKGLMVQETMPTTAAPAWADAEEETPASEESQGHIVTLTPKANRVYIQGKNKDFKDCIPDKDFFAKQYYCIIANGVVQDSKWFNNIINSVRKEGFVVLWLKTANDMENSIFDSPLTMAWPLVWNQISIAEYPWPFSPNYKVGVVISGSVVEGPDRPTPASSVISAMPTENENLPSAVVSACIKAIAPPNVAVLILGDIDPIDVLETGRVPIWFEPDKAKYDAKVAALTQYYTEMIPNVEIIVNS